MAMVSGSNASNRREEHGRRYPHGFDSCVSRLSGCKIMLFGAENKQYKKKKGKKHHPLAQLFGYGYYWIIANPSTDSH